jgi:hypothetical protein
MGNPSMDKDEVGLDASHHTRISQRGGENLFSTKRQVHETALDTAILAP